MNTYKSNTTQTIGLWLAITILSWFFNSCESFVEVELPANQLTGEAVFHNAATADAALTHIYSKMRNDVLVQGTSTGISALLSNYADEMDYDSTSGLPAQEFYQNSLIPSNNTVSSIWNGTYNLIYAANTIIEGVTASTGINAEDKLRLLGEAYFIRAYLHFYLVNLFGEVPYVNTTDYEVNKSISKSSIPNVYNNIKNDVQQAIALLPINYIGTERTRPNQSTAHALLAKTMLYMENWSEASSYADEVINATTIYTFVDDLNTVFLNNSTGTIWQLAPQFSGNNTLEAQTFQFTSAPPPTFALRNDLVDEFEAGDSRRTNWIGTVTDGTQNYYFPNKYKENTSTSASLEYSILFRLEELYLIRAEAKAHLNDLENAKTDLNKIRNRAGLANTTATTQTELLTAIIEERRKEFFTELGHRWFDLKRTGTTNSVLSSKKPGWDAKDQLWPLPESELLLNGNLAPQNPGY